MIRRDIVFSVLRPLFDIAARRFNNRPTQSNLDRLLSIMLAMECTQRRPLSVLTKMLHDVPPGEYVKRICKYKA